MAREAARVVATSDEAALRLVEHTSGEAVEAGLSAGRGAVWRPIVRMAVRRLGLPVGRGGSWRSGCAGRRLGLVG